MSFWYFAWVALLMLLVPVNAGGLPSTNRFEPEVLKF